MVDLSDQRRLGVAPAVDAIRMEAIAQGASCAFESVLHDESLDIRPVMMVRRA